ncbi:MucB/RseB C-terminal domain-containing protein [Paraferrimonas sp. SM1919]|uniref:MucB/RseB C-terminal domain-containing protein n=1 Tax=Paraferrimonas sp. SM1919 TaxID=2662263 RepID=UPI0013D8658E|nr:MucB/RseB C-terminal domain-containing protein [Paraferrimonas sp. SM1919]
MKYFAKALFGLIVASLSVSAWAQAKQMLEKMEQALINTNFKVSAIQLGSDQIKSFVYAHGVIGEQQVAMFDYLEGAPKSIIRVDDSVTYLGHNSDPYSLAYPFIPDWLPANLIGKSDAISQSYDLILSGKSRIAGRNADVIKLVAKDEHRYHYWLWIDTETSLPLRFDMVSETASLERMSVVELVVYPKPPELLVNISKQQWPSAMKTPPSKPNQWSFSWLPQGFKIIATDNHKLLGTGHVVEYVSLSDGLVDISVYLSRASSVPLPESINHHNGLAMASLQRGDFEVVAVGKAPINTLNRIVQALKSQ